MSEADEINRVLNFWRENQANWFKGSAKFDVLFRETFADLFAQAEAGTLDHWAEQPSGALALILLLDQYPRNAFRGTSRMYATDAHAARIASASARHLAEIDADLRLFALLPLSHAEDPEMQALSVKLHPAHAANCVSRARHYQRIIDAFGRFPHRNDTLGRQTTEAEQEFLDGKKLPKRRN